jgi:hypothetical protein
MLLLQDFHKLGVVVCEEGLGVLLRLDGRDQGAIRAEEDDADVGSFLGGERL